MNGEPLPSDSESLLDQYLADCLDRLDRGEALGQEVFANLPPEVASELRELLRVVAFVEDAACPPAEGTDSHAGQENNSPANSNGADAHWSEPTVHYSPENPPDEPTPVSQSDTIGKVGDYELLEELGRGGMGVVFRARQVKLNRIVALKMILSGRMASDEELRRFYSEARSVARLRHPNIVPIYDVQEDDGNHYYSMDYIEGCTLEDIAAKGSLSEGQSARYVNLIAEAVEYAHQNGILHRDLKPANVLVDSKDQPHVTDFGLAKQLEDDSQLTVSGTILGTPSFMSPEQAAGQNDQVGPTSDIYALGAILYFLLVGHPPFRGKTATETLSMVIHDEPRPIRSVNPKISRSMATICEKCLRKNPRERYQSAQELAVELERFLRGEPIQAQPVSHLRRGWVWCRDIPLVAALIGRTPSRSNLWQVRLQWLVLMVFILSGVLLSIFRIQAAMLPDEIILASGDKVGMYDLVSQTLADRLMRSTGHKVQVLKTQGSLENRDLLVSGQAHLGLIQASVLDIEQVAVIAPLYREYAHVIVRKDSEIQSLPDLNGRTIVVGREGSGDRISALKILGFFEVTEKTGAIFSEVRFSQLQDNLKLDAAVVVSGLDNPALSSLLGSGKFRLLPIPPREEMFQDSGFYPATMKAAHYPAAVLPPEEFSTVATPALLVVREGERDAIVEAACESLMQDHWLESLPGHFSPESFSYLTKSLPMHPAAVKFFKLRRQSDTTGSK